MNSFGLNLQQLRPCNVCTSDVVCWPVSCFTHDLTWRAHLLVNSGDGTKHQIIERLDTERPRGEKIGISALPRELL